MRERRSVTDVARNFAEYINRVAYRGDRFILMRGNRPVAELGPVVSGLPLGELPALLDSLPRLSDEEAKAFAEDIERARTELGQNLPANPWDS